MRVAQRLRLWRWRATPDQRRRPQGTCGERPSDCQPANPPTRQPAYPPGPVTVDQGDGVVTATDPVSGKSVVNGVDLGDKAPPLDKFLPAIKKVKKEINPYILWSGREATADDPGWDFYTYTLLMEACNIAKDLCSDVYKMWITAIRYNPTLPADADLDQSIYSVATPDIPGIGFLGTARNLTRWKAGCNSFTPGTLVLMADGTHKPIEKVQVGEQVLATDPDTGRTEPQVVVATIVGDGEKHLVEITIDTDGDTGDVTGVVVATDDHQFWVDNQHHWTTASQLIPRESAPFGEQF